MSLSADSKDSLGEAHVLKLSDDQEKNDVNDSGVTSFWSAQASAWLFIGLIVFSIPAALVMFWAGTRPFPGLVDGGRTVLACRGSGDDCEDGIETVVGSRIEVDDPVPDKIAKVSFSLCVVAGLGLSIKFGTWRACLWTIVGVAVGFGMYIAFVLARFSFGSNRLSPDVATGTCGGLTECAGSFSYVSKNKYEQHWDDDRQADKVEAVGLSVAIALCCYLWHQVSTGSFKTPPQRWRSIVAVISLLLAYLVVILDK